MDNTAYARITAFLVEDSLPIRERLVALLAGTHGIMVVGETDTPQRAVEGILRTRPDSVVLDIHLAGGSGLEVLKAVRPRAPGTLFIVLTNHPDSQYRRVFTDAGASAFLDKSTQFDLIVETILAGATRRLQIPNLQ